MNPGQISQFTVDLKTHEAIIYCCMLLNLQMVSYAALLCQEVTDTRDIICSLMNCGAKASRDIMIQLAYLKISKHRAYILLVGIQNGTGTLEYSLPTSLKN